MTRTIWPTFSLEAERPTAICDQDPSNAYMDGPESQISCYDGLEFGFRALRTRMPSVDRLYLHRGPCAFIPCTQAELDTVAVVGWFGADAHSVVITWHPSAITAPTAGAAAPWPAASSSMPPPVARPPIDGAPREVRRREPYPFCGRARPVGLTTDKPGDYERMLAINRCFFDAILGNRAVEMILITDVTRRPVVLRFDGKGFVTRYMQEAEGVGWYRRRGPVILGNSVFHGHAFDEEAVRVR